MDYGKAYDYVLNEKNDKNLDFIEKFLKWKISNWNNEIIKQEFLLILIITLLKKNNIENNEMKEYFLQLQSLTVKIEKYLTSNYRTNKDFSSKMLLDVFYTTNIYNLLVLEKLYKEIWLSSKSDKVKVIRKNMERNRYFFKKNIKNLIFSRIEKLLTNYGTSFWYLFSFTFLSTMIFWFFYMVNDLINPYPYVCGDSCVNTCEIWNSDCQTKTVKSYPYYFYVSMATMSNLWADISSAGTNSLIFLFTVEQILGVVLFWMLINLLWKNL